MSKERRSDGSSATADMVPDTLCIIHSPSLTNRGPLEPWTISNQKK